MGSEHHFFVEADNIDQEQVVITGDDVAHITKSLRLESGDQLSVADGEGNKYLVEIVETKPELVITEIKEELEIKVEPELEVTILQGLPKSKKMDLIVQKCTELGVAKIIPLETARSVVKLKPKKAQRRCQRWQKIAEEAAKQSGRAKIPQIGELRDFSQAQTLIEEYELVFLAWEEEEAVTLQNALKGLSFPQKILIIIGPEGGFSAQEVAQAKRWGAKVVSLGPRILRTETAAIATLSMLLYAGGDLGGRA
ncbi:16S rRNA (uracil(1498)-N(3))-methyltransferase [Fuchsiella alkaliacetigena]|uniref:16S rRNA (uracil(1498)-N(3))-methyltransferase n=1 Tax=Fuchsiella alkaliacetigena TaxID=957042 RepID=UPI00200A742A|nr:16S rRNA (uracil(1498)-N(3))-methyltransferase [Fuchsiella alkaliacetigena]MCK8825151.1 16S rRNA (uracil(1498)-N(3))-methyltransferase [Fuchsiella alkaliacetigena]